MFTINYKKISCLITGLNKEVVSVLAFVGKIVPGIFGHYDNSNVYKARKINVAVFLKNEWNKVFH